MLPVAVRWPTLNRYGSSGAACCGLAAWLSLMPAGVSQQRVWLPAVTLSISICASLMDFWWALMRWQLWHLQVLPHHQGA